MAIGGLALGSVGLVIPGKLSVPGVFLLFIDHDHTIYAIRLRHKKLFPEIYWQYFSFLVYLGLDMRHMSSVIRLASCFHRSVCYKLE